VINQLSVPKAAHFYTKRRRLTRVALVDLFRHLRGSAQNPSRNLFLHVKESTGGVTWSAIAFSYERNPKFLDPPPTSMRERVSGYVLIAEYREHVVICKAGLDVPISFKNDFLKPVAEERIETAIAKADSIFEQIRLRSMAASKHALRSKTLEADDLRNVLPPSGTSRFIASIYRLRRGADHYSATPSTGRISMRSDRIGYRALLEWVAAVINALNDDAATPSQFITQFARPIDFEDLPKSVLPSYVAMDVPALTDMLLEADAPYQFVRLSADGEPAILETEETKTVLTALDRTFEIRKGRHELRLVSDNDHKVGEIRIGKTRIALRALSTPGIEGVYVQDSTPIPGGAAAPIPLRKFIDQENLITVLFTDFTIVYIEGRLYKDNSIMGGGA
jgi:hypothetical protein